MSKYVHVKVTDTCGDTVWVEAEASGTNVFVGVLELDNGENRSAIVALTVDQCAALIAAITDAARVVTGEKA